MRNAYASLRDQLRTRSQSLFEYLFTTFGCEFIAGLVLDAIQENLVMSQKKVLIRVETDFVRKVS